MKPLSINKQIRHCEEQVRYYNELIAAGSHAEVWREQRHIYVCLLNTLRFMKDEPELTAEDVESWYQADAERYLARARTYHKDTPSTKVQRKARKLVRRVA